MEIPSSHASTPPLSARIARIVAIVLLLFVGIGARPAGYNYVTDPSGASMGQTTELLQHSPFTSFLIPGIVLLICNGLFNIVVAIASILKFKYHAPLITAQGAILLGWIGAQIGMLRMLNGLQIAIGVIAVVLLICGGILWRRG